MTHEYAGETVAFHIQYKRRKTIGIYIDLYGGIEVRAPKGTTEETILRFIELKWDWIQKNSKERKDRTSGYKEKEYIDGEEFLYLGNSYPIKINRDITVTKEVVVFQENELILIVKEYEEEKMKQAIKRFYYQQCKALVESRIKYYQKHFKVKPHSIRISDNKSNWGTCDSKLRLSFNWKLAMAPLDVIDYVVVHEMCHMVHLNHDRSFWRMVGKIIPDYEERKKWLALSSWKMTI